MDLLIKMLAELPFSHGELSKLIKSAPRRYKIYQIPKRTPGQFRTIAHPSRELKFLQRWLVSNVLMNLPVHTSATAYRTGTSILDNANCHVKQRYLLKMDIKNFFPSIKPRDFNLHCNSFLPNLNQQDLLILDQILFRRNKETKTLELAIGAPSSPLVSNSIFFNLDNEISSYCQSQNIFYSRYADDLTFSTNQPHILQMVPAIVAQTLESANYPTLKINSAKTVHSSKKHHRQVTGLVLSSENRVSIGRSKKRLLKGLIFRYLNGKLSIEETSNLRGQISFVSSVEPSFVSSLKNKYGSEVIKQLIQSTEHLE